MVRRLMVATPWGDSEKLQSRRLTPGPGTSPAAVAENQRGRIYGAMVASVADLGYEATRVADISGISGVSSRSFYNLFPGGKDQCFMAVIREILKETLAALAGAGEGEKDWERRLLATYQQFAELVVAQPAAASLLLTEGYAAGQEATKALDQATSAFERLSRRRLQESPERAELPASMIQAQVGALQELARARLGRGEAGALPLLVPELVELFGGYRPPPDRLRRTTRRPPSQPEEIPSPEEAERAIRGFTLAVAEHGYASVTIQEIARHSGMSPNTFYANFRDKREALLATIDTSTAQLAAFAMAAYRRSPGWAIGVRAMIGSVLGFLASRPATANILLAEVYGGGPEALNVRARGIRELTQVLEEGMHDKPGVPGIAAEAILGGLIALARRQLLRKGADSLPSLTPIASYFALAPYLGPTEACSVANGDGRGRAGADQKTKLPRMAVHRTKWLINSMLGSRWATAEEIADELGASATEITRELEELEREGLVERIVPLDDKKATEWTNTRLFRMMDGENWTSLTPDERRRVTSDGVRLLVSELAEGLRRQTFGHRLDEHHTRLIIELDEQGWGEIAEVHRAAFNATQSVKERSDRRLRQSGGGELITGRSVQLLFELPADI